MAFDKNSSGFTFAFAGVMVVITAILLAVAAISLKPFQDDNIRKEKMQNILSSLRVKVVATEAEAKFNEMVKEQIVLNANGELVEGIQAFNIDVQKEYKELKAGARKSEEMHYPLYVCEINGNTYYAVPMVGTGLWGPVWGYVTLESDLNTVYGANFDHKGETPGLGAEINTEAFQKNFIGKKIFDDAGVYQSIKVVKGGALEGDMHGVDGITGGTITSNGVAEMLYRSIEVYVPYFKSKGKTEAVEPIITDSADTIGDSLVISDQIETI